VNFIPTGKTYEAIVACYCATATIPGKEKKCTEALAFVQQRAPVGDVWLQRRLAALTTARQEFAARGAAAARHGE